MEPRVADAMADAGRDAAAGDGGAVDSGPRDDAGGSDAGGLAIGGTRFFGFVAIDCAYDDPLDTSTRTQYVDELSEFTNVAHLCASGADEDLTPRLDRFAAAGLRAIVDVGDVLFESVPGTSQADPTRRLALRSDAEARLSRWLTRNAAVLDDAHVAALYVVDEPAWNGLPVTDFESAATMLDEATDLPLFFVEAGDALDTLVIPAAIDLVGFDRYDTRDPSTDAAWLADLVVGILAYLWPGGLDTPTQLGARELPSSVTDVYRELGAAVRGRTP